MFFDNSKYFVFEKELCSFRGDKINVYKLANELLDDDTLNTWASSLRNNYCEAHLLDSLIDGTGLSKEEYLKTMIFPNPSVPQGAATMSGEFGEILIFDYINFVLNYFVTRTRYLDKINPNMPVPGSDVMGYKIHDISKPNKSDRLIVAEVKTRSSVNGKKLCEKTIGTAIDHSVKDRIRIGEPLNAEKRRLLNRSKFMEAKVVERFQNKTDNPFMVNFFAVAVLDSDLYSDQDVLTAIDNHHEIINSTNVLVIHSKELKLFLRDLYRRACIC